MNENELLDLWHDAFLAVDPVFLLQERRILRSLRPWEADAYLFWGKVSARFLEALSGVCPDRPASGRGFVGSRSLNGSRFDEKRILGIYPKSKKRSDELVSQWPGRWIAAEHPLPGAGSFRAGREILEFFDGLRRYRSRSLLVFLSGGASSLAWLPREPLTQRDVLKELQQLYRSGLDIDQLNAQRAKLCQLKGGGAAAWLSRLAPQVRVRVAVLSDVAPHGPEVVGSGPFWNGRIAHHVLADNRSLVRALESEARHRGLRVLHSSSARLGSSLDWLKSIQSLAIPALKGGEDGLLIFGGEPSVVLPESGKLAGRGGRQSHLVLALAMELRPWIEAGQVEILGMSSDGSDGVSGAAGAFIGSLRFSRARLSKRSQEEFFRKGARALACRDSARFLAQNKALIPGLSVFSRSNVQDVLLLRLRGVTGKPLA